MSWEDRLKVAREQGGFTEADRDDARTWDRCPLSEHTWHHREFVGATDTATEFYHAVASDNVEKARKLYDEIQEQAKRDYEWTWCS